MKLTPIALIGSCLIVGCGGSGGSSSPVVPYTTMRSNVAGDSWTYSVKANLPIMGSSSGTLSNVLSVDTFNAQPATRDTETFSLTSQQGTANISTYREYDQNGQLTAVVSGGQVVLVSSNTFLGPRILGPTTNITGTLTLADGTSVSESYKVIGIKQVTVPAGVFNCWIVKDVQVQSGGTKDQFTLYVAPETGNWVEADARTDYSGGQVFTWHAELASQTTSQTTARTVSEFNRYLAPAVLRVMP